MRKSNTISILSLLIIVLLFVSTFVFAATNDFTADGDIIVSAVTFGATTADMLIFSGSTAESWTYDSSTFTVTNPGSLFMVGSSDNAVKSIIIKDSGNTNVACAENSIPETSYVTLPTTADTYTIEPSTTTDCTSLCSTLSNVATYNTFPTCGAATCSSNYQVSGSGSSATCIGISGAGPVAYNPPTNASVVIDGNAESADSRNVTLTLTANNVIQVAISNSESFTGISWETFTITKQWILSEGVGLKTVYVKFRSSAGDTSEVVWDTINLTELGASQEVSEIPADAGVITDGSLICNPNAEGIAKFDIYIVKLVGSKKFKRLILSPHVFESYQHFDKNGNGDKGWNDVINVNQAIMDAYTISNLVRADGDTKVYELTADGDTGTKQWLNMTVSTFEAAGYDCDSIYEINAVDRDAYAVGNEITINGSLTIVIQVLSLKVRNSPSLDSNVINSVSSGETYNILEERDSWYKISVGDVIGWCFGGTDNEYAVKQ